MEKSETADLQWRKARRSVGNGACVELAAEDGQIFVRDSMNPAGAWLRYPAQSFMAFAVGMKGKIIFE